MDESSLIRAGKANALENQALQRILWCARVLMEFCICTLTGLCADCLSKDYILSVFLVLYLTKWLGIRLGSVMLSVSDSHT